MSRRSRRRRSAGGAGWLGKALIGLILLGVVGGALLYASVRGYLHSDAFRRFLSAKVSAAARVDGRFTPFRWDGLAVDTSGFDATGTGVVRELRLEGLHTEVGLSGLRRGAWQIKDSRVQRVEVLLDGRKSGDEGIRASRPPETPVPEGGKSWLPKEVEVQGVDVAEIAARALFENGELAVSGVRARVEPGGAKHAYRVELADGTIRPPLPLVPEVRLRRAKLRWQDGQAFLSSLNASVYQDGAIEATGEWDAASGKYTAEGAVTDVRCDEVFNDTWAKRVSGRMESDFSLENHGGPLVARGRLTIRDGVLTALPVLDALAAYADTRRFRVLSLGEARTDWRWKSGELFLSNLTLASEGLVRLEGSLKVRDRNLDGLFRLGLAPGTLARIPGAETHVFAPGERGLLWTPLRITGTLDDPKEDLTDRLISAAGLRMFDVIPETGEKVIKFSRSLIGETPGKAVDQGVKIIERGADVVEGVGGVLDGILGGGRREPEKKEDP